MEFNEIQTLIDQYLAKTLSLEERDRFERLLQQDEDVKKQYEDTLNMVDGIRYSESKKLLKKLQKLESEKPYVSQDTPSSARVIPLMKSGIAAAAVVALGILAYTFLMPKSIDFDSMYAQNYSPEPSEIVQRTVEDQEQLAQIKAVFSNHDSKQVYNAFYAFHNKKYKDAVNLFSNLISKENHPMFVFFLGQSHMGNQSYEAAQKTFDQYLSSGDVTYQESSIWYKGLILLKQKKEDELKKLWKDFVKKTCTNCIKAKEILNSLV